MEILRTKIWHWYDIGLLKWSVLLFGMIAGAYLADIVLENLFWFFLAAAILAVRPAVVYWSR
jgi:hypothetical protein